jgi:two-component system cell cycle sensor histidine kinase/response regulator CckA
VISGYGGLLDKELAPHDPCRIYLKEIRGASERAASLTRQLLAFSRKQIFRPMPLDLNQFIEDMQQMIQRLVGEDIAVETRPAPDLALVSADPDQISQILMNLAANARDAMPDGGRLIIRTANSAPHQAASAANRDDRPESVLLAVTDTGVGIPEENRQHLFEPFFSTKERGRGTGLGLSSVYGIVQQSDGWIDVQSEPGQGTTFSIYLPAIESLTAIEPVQQPLTTAVRFRASGTVLVVEDQEEVRTLMKAVLESEGFNVLTAGGGDAALSLARWYSEAIHLLITDVIMPDMTGKQVADRLAPMRPGIKVLYISGHSGDVLAQRGVLEPDVAYLPKPFTSVTLSARVREILGSGATA